VTAVLIDRVPIILDNTFTDLGLLVVGIIAAVVAYALYRNHQSSPGSSAWPHAIAAAVSFASFAVLVGRYV
jgi:hypothetical protein